MRESPALKIGAHARRASAPRSPTTTRTCPRCRSSAFESVAAGEGLAACDLAVIVTAHDEIDIADVVAQAHARARPSRSDARDRSRPRRPPLRAESVRLRRSDGGARRPGHAGPCGAGDGDGRHGRGRRTGEARAPARPRGRPRIRRSTDARDRPRVGRAGHRLDPAGHPGRRGRRDRGLRRDAARRDRPLQPLDGLHGRSRRRAPLHPWDARRLVAARQRRGARASHPPLRAGHPPGVRIRRRLASERRREARRDARASRSASAWA